MLFEFDLIVRVVVFLINFFGLWLIFWVYFRSQNNNVKRWFSFLVLSSLVWTDFAYLARIAGSQHLEWSLIFTKITWSAVPLFFISIYFFVSFFLRFKKNFKRKILNSIVLIIGIICWVSVIFTDLIVERIVFENGSYYRYILGKGMNWFLLAVLFYMALELLLLFRSYFKISEEKRIQIQYLLLGVSILYVMNSIFNVFLPVFRGVTQYYQFGDYSNFVFLSFTAYAITKKKLFGMKIVLTTIIVGLISAFLMMDVLIFSEEFIIRLWKTLILVLFLYFGYLLVKSVLAEIKQRQEIEKLSKAKSEFISIASHQLRTPLTAVKGYISMILEGTYGKLPKKAERPMRNVYTSNEALIKLVNDLLSLSRIESGKMQVEMKKASLSDLISSIVGIFNIEAKKKNIYLKFKKPKKAIPNVLMDPDKMREVISNIVNNAIKYTQKGGITISLEDLESSVRVVIRDTGAGMTQEEIGKVFQSFSRGVAGTKHFAGGAGLGLYVSKQFVKMQKGNVWVESKGRGRGSTFYIELPKNQ